MSFPDDLREVGRQLPTSHIPSDGELKPVVGAIMLLLEHGYEKFNAVVTDDKKLFNLLATGDPDTTPKVMSPELEAAQSRAQGERILELEQQVATMSAILQRSVGTIESESSPQTTPDLSQGAEGATSH